MPLLTQPPPDAPAPPPGEQALRSRRKMNLIWWLGGLSIGFAVLLVLAPFFLKARKASERTEALNNIRQIGMCLFEFDSEYGRFPDATTIAEVKARTSTKLTLKDTSSNQLFRQLIAAGMKSEKPFYAKIPGSKRVDERYDTDATALERGECGFSYVAGLSSSGDAETPVVLTPMKRGTANFDTSATKFGEKAIVLHADNSARLHFFNTHGQAIIGGRNLFDAAQPYWKGKYPDLKWHE